MVVGTFPFELFFIVLFVLVDLTHCVSLTPGIMGPQDRYKINQSIGSIYLSQLIQIIHNSKDIWTPSERGLR